MWLLQRHRGTDSGLNVVSAFLLRGELNLPALREAMLCLPARHEALRTTLVRQRGELQQLVHAMTEHPDDLFVEADVARADLADVVRAEVRYGFDLAAQWPVRLRVFRVLDGDAPSGDYLAVLTMHHLAVDGASMDILHDDLATLYALHAGFADRQPEPVGWQYPDLAEWQRQRRDAGELEPQLTYWRDRLAGFAPTDLAAAIARRFPDTAPARDDTGFTRFDVPTAIVAGLARFAAQERVTPFMVVFAALCTHLSSVTGETDVVVPTMFSNRLRPQVARTVGFLANPLALRIDLSGRPSPAETVGLVRTAVLGAMTRQEIPYQLVAGGGGGFGSPAMLIEYQSMPDDALTLPGVEVRAYQPPPIGADSFDLELHLGARGTEGLVVNCFYPPARLTNRQATGFLGGLAETMRQFDVD